MAERVAIVGSRDFGSDRAAKAAEAAVKAFVAALPDGTVVVSGGAFGVDTWAARAADHAGLIRVEVLPAWVRRDGTADRGAGFARNGVIVELCDRLVAFRCVGKSNGTDDVVAKARKAGKPVEVVVIE